MTGLAIGLALTAVIIVLPFMNYDTDIESTEDRQFINSVASLSAARKSPVMKAFIETYPDYSIKFPEGREAIPSDNGNYTAIETSMKVEGTAYYNSTTGTIINEDNSSIDNKTIVITPANSHKVAITNTMRLLVHVLQHTDSLNSTSLDVVPVWLRCSTEASPGSSMTAELVYYDPRDSSSQTRAKEGLMIQYIQEGRCFPSNLP
jgi:hypothetical protein